MGCIPLVTSLPWLVIDSGLEISYGWLGTTRILAPSWSLWFWTTNCDWEVYCICSFIWVVDCISLRGDLHLELCFLWRSLVHMSHHTTSYGRNDLCPASLYFVLKIHLSNIRFRDGVFVSLTYSFPFLKISFVCLSITRQFASKSNCHCKFWVTIQFILLHNSLSSESIDHSAILMVSTT